jgi:hypothetical protein
MNFKVTTARRNQELDALAANFNSGFLRIYSGVQPADADTALSGNTLLAELTFGATAFPAAAGGVLTANAIADDASADATGTATFFRCFKSDGVTVICDGDAGVGSQNLVLNTTSIVAAARVQATTFTISLA